MSGLSRRKFLGTAGALSAAYALPFGNTARALAEPLAPVRNGATTLDQTIIRGWSTNDYYPLVWGSGEPFIVRDDLGARAAPARAQSRRSILYFQLGTDDHIIDSQNCARWEWAASVPEVGGSASRPQETLTTQAFNQMAVATNTAATSPVTGAPLAFSIQTGDNADTSNLLELRWFIDILDGKEITPNSGNPGAYEGTQKNPHAWYAYHPEPDFPVTGGPFDWYARMDFPLYPGLLDAATQPFRATGLNVPWYAVWGNHDSIWSGFMFSFWEASAMAPGPRKAWSGEAVVAFLLWFWAPEFMHKQISDTMWTNDGYIDGTWLTTTNPERKLVCEHSYEAISAYMQEFFDTADNPGPRGHGFSEDNVANHTTWWSRTIDNVHLIGLDTCNHYYGDGGSIIEPQFDWLEQELKNSSSWYYEENGDVTANPGVADRFIVVASHHNSATMDNFTRDPLYPYPRFGAEKLITLLWRFPNVILWANGHTHWNQITPHANELPGVQDGRGFWEVNTASCIDWAQQSRLLEIVDNRDGTVSIFTISLDHAANPSTDGSTFTTERLASIGRELSANDHQHWQLSGAPVPDPGRGAPQDRNSELVLLAPPAAAAVDDEALDLATMKRRAQLLSRV